MRADLHEGICLHIFSSNHFSILYTKVCVSTCLSVCLSWLDNKIMENFVIFVDKGQFLLALSLDQTRNQMLMHQ